MLKFFAKITYTLSFCIFLHHNKSVVILYHLRVANDDQIQLTKKVNPQTKCINRIINLNFPGNKGRVQLKQGSQVTDYHECVAKLCCHK